MTKEVLILREINLEACIFHVIEVGYTIKKQKLMFKFWKKSRAQREKKIVILWDSYSSQKK